MNKLSLKKLLFLIPIALLLIGLIFWRPILTRSMEFGIKRFCCNVLEGDFDAERMTFEQGRWIFDKPRLIKRQPIAEGGMQIQAERLAIRIIPHLFSREVDVEILVVKPQADVKQASSKFHRKLMDSLAARGLVALNSRIIIQQGSISLHDFRDPTPSQQTVYFQLDVECGQGTKGCLMASLDDPELKKNCVVLSLAQMEKRHVALDLDFSEVDCASLIGAGSSFFPMLQDIAIEKGTLKGKLALTVPKEGAPFAVGDLTMRDLSFCIPNLEIRGALNEAHIHLQENEDPRSQPSENGVKPSMPRTVGHLELVRGANIAFDREGIPFCEISDLAGEVYFQTRTGARLHFDGKCEHHGIISALKTDGEARFASKEDGSFDLNIALGSEEEQEASIHFVIRQWGTHLKFAEIGFTNIGPSEFDLFMALLSPHFPETRQIHMAAGRINASALAYLEGLHLTDLKIEKMHANDVQFDIDPWGWSACVHELSGDVAVSLDTAKPLETLNADLLIANGQLRLNGQESDPYQLSDVHSKLTIRRGIVMQSIVEGKFVGLKGTIHLDGQSPDGEVVKFNFAGEAQGLMAVAPESLRKRIKQYFNDDHLTISAGVRTIPGAVQVKGIMHCRPQLEETGQTIHFGFDLEKVSQKIWGKRPLHRQAADYWLSIGLEATLAYLPPLAAPTALLETQWLRNEIGVSGFMFRNGWFQALNLPLAKYLAPIVFSDSNVTVQGVGDFNGSFDHASAIINYDMRNLNLESKDFKLTVKGLQNFEEEGSEGLPGIQFFEFASGDSYGTVPLDSAAYLEKHSGLLFTDISALVSFSGAKIRLEELQTVCSGVNFKGKLDLDLNIPGEGCFEANIYATAGQGKFSQVQRMFLPFPKLNFFQKFPGDGNLQLSEKGLAMQIRNRDGQLDIQTSIAGTLHEGALNFRNVDVAAKDVKLNFDYNQAAETLEVRDIAGTVLIGKGNEIDTYALSGDQIIFANLSKNEAEFDIWIGDQKRDIIRIAGKTYTNPEEQSLDDDVIHVMFDQAVTHFGDVHPTVLDLSLKNWMQIDSLNFKFELSLETMMHDLQVVGRTGLFCLPPLLQKELAEVKHASGRFAVNLNYESKASTIGYHAIGQDVKLGSYEFKKCSLHGCKKDCTWSIDQLILDDLTVAADIEAIPVGWKFNFLGLHYGNSLLAGLEGEYRYGNEFLDAKVNLLEFNLDRMDEWPELQNFIDEYHPKGHLRANGQLHIEFPSSAKKWRLDTLLSGNLRTLELKGIPFEDVSNASFHFVSDRGLTIRQLQTAFKDPLTGEIMGALNIGKLERIQTTDEFIADEIKFNIPVENLKRTGELLRNCYPEIINEGLAAIISDLKREGYIEGTYSIHKTPISTLSELTLKEGTYHFQGLDHEVNHFSLKYDLNELKILTQYRYQNYLFWLIAKSRGPAFASGIILMSDYHPEHQQPQPKRTPLHIDWKNDPHVGFQVTKAEGYFAGMDVRLANDPDVPMAEEAIYLLGEIDLKPQRSALLVSQELSEKMKLFQVGEGYTLKGRWRLGKAAIREEDAGQWHFHGYLEGKDFVLKGYRFQQLIAEANYVPGSIELRRIHIEDPSGSFSIEKADIFQMSDGRWRLDVPFIAINNLRPSLLQDVTSSEKMPVRPLLVRRLEIEHLQGDCSNIESIRGTGKLLFINPPKKNLQNTILAIPAEILTMIGLDLTVLNPVSGTIMYDIRDGKVYLSKFKDVYSEGKLSKFNLSNVGHPSYVDFDGNLHVQIRMKQHNLFFKLAELFTVNIGGTLLKPTYSLQRQH